MISPLCNVIARTVPISEHLQRIDHEKPLELEASMAVVDGLYRIISDPLMTMNDIIQLSQVPQRRPVRPISSQPRASPWVDVVRSLRPVRAKA